MQTWSHDCPKDRSKDARVVNGNDLTDDQDLANEQFDAVFSNAGKFH